MALSLKSEAKNNALLLIGQIIAAHGLTGAVKVRPLTDFPERFQHLREVYVLAVPEQEQDSQVFRLREVPFPMKQQQVLSFEGIADRTAAESLLRHYIAIPRSEAVQLPAETFYLHQLEGLQVLNSQGENIGIVTAIIPGPQDLLEVTAEDKTHLIPFVKALVPVVDLPKGIIRVDLPDGLLDL